VRGDACQITRLKWKCPDLFGARLCRFGLPGKDTIVSRYEKPYDQVKAAAIAVLKRNGTLVGDDLIKKVLEARIDTTSVFVGLDDNEPKITKVSVQVRRGAVADIDLAAEISKQIYGQLITQSQ